MEQSAARCVACPCHRCTSKKCNNDGRNMRGDEARKQCAGLQLVQVPTANGKADLTLYRNHGKQVLP